MEAARICLDTIILCNQILVESLLRWKKWSSNIVKLVIFTGPITQQPDPGGGVSVGVEAGGVVTLLDSLY